MNPRLLLRQAALRRARAALDLEEAELLEAVRRISRPTQRRCWAEDQVTPQPRRLPRAAATRLGAAQRAFEQVEGHGAPHQVDAVVLQTRGGRRA